jgi:hypothetical protein
MSRIELSIVDERETTPPARSVLYTIAAIGAPSEKSS